MSDPSEEQVEGQQSDGSPPDSATQTYAAEQEQPEYGLSHEQVEQLLRPVNPQRVLLDPRGNEHLSQQDVTAHLIRVFGFGGHDYEIVDSECIFEEQRVDNQGKLRDRWNVSYRCHSRLTVKDRFGNPVAINEDVSTGSAQNLPRGDAHDNAYKSAVSTAKKRCAIAWGDQFGLSLYNKGQLEALVRGTLVRPEHEDAETEEGDVQEGVPQQVAMGNDETSYATELPPLDMTVMVQQVRDAGDEVTLRALWQKASQHEVLDSLVDPENVSVGDLIVQRREAVVAAVGAQGETEGEASEDGA